MDQDLDKVLEATLARPAERKIDSITTIVFTMAREQFGTQERQENSGTPGKGPNRQESEISQLSREIKTLNMQLRRDNAEEKEGI